MVLHNCQSPADRHATLSGGFMSLCAIANECVAVLALQTLREVAEDLPSMLWWRCDDGGTILHAACTRGHADVVRSVVRMLQGYGAEGAQGVDLGTLLHMTDAEGRFPLYIAVTRGDLALVHLLLSVGASPNSGRATTVGRFSSSNSPIVTVSTCVEAAFASAAWSVLRELIGAGACVSDFTRRVLPVSLQPVVEFLHECVEVVDAVFARVEALRGAPYPQAVFSPSTTDREVGRYLAAVPRCILPASRCRLLTAASAVLLQEGADPNAALRCAVTAKLFDLWDPRATHAIAASLSAFRLGSIWTDPEDGNVTHVLCWVGDSTPLWVTLPYTLAHSDRSCKCGVVRKHVAPGLALQAGDLVTFEFSPLTLRDGSTVQRRKFVRRVDTNTFVVDGRRWVDASHLAAPTSWSPGFLPGPPAAGVGPSPWRGLRA